jgi:hypothetical protein
LRNDIEITSNPKSSKLLPHHILLVHNK